MRVKRCLCDGYNRGEKGGSQIHAYLGSSISISNPLTY